MTDRIRGHAQERSLIQRNSQNLLRLINQLLDLSKLEAGKLTLELVQGDIIRYLQYLTESFYSMAREKDIRLLFYPEVDELVMAPRKASGVVVVETGKSQQHNGLWIKELGIQPDAGGTVQ